MSLKKDFCKIKISLSVVTYKTDISDIERVIRSIGLSKLDWTLFIVDNSPTDELRFLLDEDQRIKYIFNNDNLGFGAGHNIAINLAGEAGINHHFVVNPDIFFHVDVLTPMVEYMKKDSQIGMMMPEVLFPDGKMQFLPKLLPHPLWLVKRKIKKPYSWHKKFIDKYELRRIRRNVIYNTPILSGCFTLINLESIKELGDYDERYFMYLEDFDLSRRIHQKYKTLYFPEVSVFHGYESGANSNVKLLRIFMVSVWIYFNKWGWFFDKERREINTKVLNEIKGDII